jgi:uncharacterized protein (TIGR02466 family)
MIVSLFPDAMYISDDKYVLTKKQFDTIMKLDMKQNISNKVSKETYLLNKPTFRKLKNWLEKETNRFAKEVLKWNSLDFYITQSWVNVATKGESHHGHRHPNSMLSGVYYISPEECHIRMMRDTKMWGNFVFDHDPEQENEFNTLSAKVPVEQNRVVIFLSEQVHSVDPIEDDSIRISLAFNCFAKGNLGGRGHSSELIL